MGRITKGQLKQPKKIKDKCIIHEAKVKDKKIIHLTEVTFNKSSMWPNLDKISQQDQI